MKLAIIAIFSAVLGAYFNQPVLATAEFTCKAANSGLVLLAEGVIKLLS